MEQNSKPPTGENVVLHEKISRVKPSGGKKLGILEKESLGIENSKRYPSWRQTELIPRCQQDNSNKDPSWRQIELIPSRQQKQRGIPERESTGIFILKGDPSWRQKEVIPRCQWDKTYVVYNFYTDPNWRQKELIPRCQQENFVPTKFEIQIWDTARLKDRKSVLYIKYSTP